MLEVGAFFDLDISLFAVGTMISAFNLVVAAIANFNGTLAYISNSSKNQRLKVAGVEIESGNGINDDDFESMKALIENDEVRTVHKFIINLFSNKKIVTA